MNGRRVPQWPGLSAAYPLIVGGVVSALLVAPIGIGGVFQYGAWLYVAAVVAGVTFAIDRLLRIPLARWAPPNAFIMIPFVAAAIGILVGWWAVNYTMGGPV